MNDDRDGRGPDQASMRQCFSPAAPTTDDEIDRVLARLTEASPSPDLRATVMRRIADEHVSSSDARRSGVRRSIRLAPDARWRLALAGAAVILIGASIWLAVRPGSVSQTTRVGPPAHDVTLPGAPQTTAPYDERQIASRTASPRVEQTGATARMATRRTASAGVRIRSSASGLPNEVANDAAVDVAPGVPPIEVQPLPDLSPVVIPPIGVVPIEIPEIQIPPVEDRSDKTSPPAKTDPEKKQSGGPRSAPAE